MEESITGFEAVLAQAVADLPQARADLAEANERLKWAQNSGQPNEVVVVYANLVISARSRLVALTADITRLAIGMAGNPDSASLLSFFIP
jgi:hypothetical protein